MSWLIIVLVVALALAPLLHFAPSKHQRRVARLREQAALQGLFVEFRDLPPGTPSQGGGGNPIYYGKRLPASRGEGPAAGCWLREEGSWRALDRRRAVPPQLLELPAMIAVASLDSGSCGIYWRETGEEQEIERIREVLEAWTESLSR